MAFDILKRILKKFYKENETKVVYHFGDREVVRILGDWVLSQRRLINTDEFDVNSVSIVGNTLEFLIQPKEDTPPPPPPPHKDTPPGSDGVKDDIKDTKSDDAPQRSSL